MEHDTHLNNILFLFKADKMDIIEVKRQLNILFTLEYARWKRDELRELLIQEPIFKEESPDDNPDQMAGEKEFFNSHLSNFEHLT